ncbi:MAG: ankyrin repeat domain-containing protein [Candidatus Methylacidiphilales bacterium]|nr:ankyrin repeat domain-containing protein [Candidatus Methylacidiphilales bacterium]
MSSASASSSPLGSHSLPAQPSIRQLQVQAKELAAELKARKPDALARFERVLGRIPPAASSGNELKLSDAQLILSREYGCDNWAALTRKVDEILAATVTPEQIEELKRAIESGGKEGAASLKAVLQKYPGLKSKLNEPLFGFGSVALLEAVRQQNREMIDVLLEAGADINRRSDWAPGSFGVLDNIDSDLADFLIERGAVVDVHAAAGHAKISRLKELLDANPALVNARGGDGGTPMHFARNVEVAQLLLDRGADVHIRDLDHGSTAAMWQVKNRPILDLLIAAGSPVDIYMACYHGDRALAERALHENPKCLGYVIAHNEGDGEFAQDTGGNIYNWTIGHAARPIPLALQRGHRELAEWLLTKATPAQRFVALCFDGQESAARDVFQRHPEMVAEMTENDRRALPQAIHFGNIAAARLMIELGFPLDVPELFDRGTLLHSAAWHGRADLVRTLVARRPEWLENKDNNHESTPLGWACHGSLHCWGRGNGDYAGTVQAMIDGGKDLTELDLEEADQWAAPEVVAVLRKSRK